MLIGKTTLGKNVEVLFSADCVEVFIAYGEVFFEPEDWVESMAMIAALRDHFKRKKGEKSTEVRSLEKMRANLALFCRKQLWYGEIRDKFGSQNSIAFLDHGKKLLLSEFKI